MLTKAKGWLGGILVHCTLLSTSHFVNQTSLARPPGSATTLTRFQLVNVSGCMQACWRGRKGWAGERDGHMKGLHVVKMVVEDGPLKHCSHYALPKEKKKKRQSSGNEMTPLDPAVMWHLCFPSLPSNQTYSCSMKFPLLIYFWLLLRLVSELTTVLYMTAMRRHVNAPTAAMRILHFTATPV